MLGFEMRYEKRAKDYGIGEGHTTENGVKHRDLKKKKQDERYKRMRNISLLHLSKIAICEQNKRNTRLAAAFFKGIVLH